jgi:catechol 2,3-dioxygenase
MYLQTRLGGSVLRVINLQQELAYYQKLGMKPLRKFRENGYETIELVIGVEDNLISEIDNPPILTLMHDAEASRPYHNSAGLFHFAILTPDRKSLASTFVYLENQGVKFTGFADHLVSESLYLQDPEDNGIEIYCDRPSEGWQFDRNGHIQMDTIALNLESLLSELYNRDDSMVTKNFSSQLRPFPSGGSIGHIHLKVTNLAVSTNFYREILGFDLMQSMQGASFLSTMGYHHRLALNTWISHGGASLTGKEAGLEHFTIHISDREFYEQVLKKVYEASIHKINSNEVIVTDPDGIRMKLIYNSQ